MKVLLVHDKRFRLSARQDDAPGGLEGPVGGIDVYLSCLVGGLREAGLDIAMVRFVEAPAEGAGSVPGYYEVRSSTARMFSAVSDIARVVETEKPDVIHLHSSYYPLTLPMLRRLRNLGRVVYTLHDVTPLCFRHTRILPDGGMCEATMGLSCINRKCVRPGGTRFFGDCFRLFMAPMLLREYRRLRMIITPSRYLRDQLVDMRFDRDRIRVIPHFSRFHGVHRGKAGGNLSILFVGRLVKEKGILEFVEALSLLRTRRNWHAVVVGDGQLSGPARILAERCGLSGRIRFAGEASAAELERHYMECALVVMPSLIPESFGLVGIEAMSFGKPVVAFRAGGVTEWLKDGENGLLCDRGDIGALVRRIDRLIDDDLLRERMGEHGRQLVSERFTVAAHLDGLKDVYTRLGAGEGMLS